MQLTPKQSEAMEALASEKFNFILYGGAIRGGKSVWGLSALLVLCQIFPHSRWCVIREDMEKIRTTTIPSFKKLEPSGSLRQSPYEYTHPNGSVILFKSENYAQDKDLDWMKGLEVNGFLLEEINEEQQQTFYKAFERAGAWIIPNTDIQPEPIILATCNPTFGWVKELIYDRWKNNTLPEKWLYIPAKITDNPHLPEAYIANLKNLPRFEYMVFVEGNWDIQLKTGGEFYSSFELFKHVCFARREETTIHISLDSNVYPYIAIIVFQLIKKENGWVIRQIDELPAREPENSANKAGKKIANYLKKIGYNQPVYLYGDRSTKNRNNIDDDKRSFFKIVDEAIKTSGFITHDKMDTKAPPVASIAGFVNAIFEGNIKGLSIEIGEHCKESISDYIETKTDKDGGMLKKRISDPKTGVSYEPNGHISDCLKDFVYQAFRNEYEVWLNRFRNVAPLVGKNISKNSY